MSSRNPASDAARWTILSARASQMLLHQRRTGAVFGLSGEIGGFRGTYASTGLRAARVAQGERGQDGDYDLGGSTLRIPATQLAHKL